MSQDYLIAQAADLCLQLDRASLAQLLDILASHAGGQIQLVEIMQSVSELQLQYAEDDSTY